MESKTSHMPTEAIAQRAKSRHAAQVSAQGHIGMHGVVKSARHCTVREKEAREYARTEPLASVVDCTNTKFCISPSD